MQIKVRVLNSWAVDSKMKCVKDKPKEESKVLTSSYLRDLNRDVTSRIRQGENVNKEAYLVRQLPLK